MTRTAIMDILKTRSVKISRARVDIMYSLLKKGTKLTSLPEIYNNYGTQFNRITIYRTLITLCDTGLIYKILDTNNRPFYAVVKWLSAQSDQIQSSCKEYCHFQCESCKSVFCFPCNFQDIKLPDGLIKTGVNLFFTGYCPKCSGKAKNIPGKKIKKRRVLKGNKKF